MTLTTNKLTSFFVMLAVGLIGQTLLAQVNDFQPGSTGLARPPATRPATNQAPARAPAAQQKRIAPRQPVFGSRLGTPRPKVQSPLELTGEFLLQEGSTQGLLILKANVSPGSYIYSTTQSGDLRPSVIAALPSPTKNYITQGTFTAHDAPIVIKHDPVMRQRVEKHKGLVRFTIPFQIAPNTDPRKVIAMIQFDGQVCSDQGLCMPIREKRVEAKFAGYFPSKPAAPQNPNQARSARLETQPPQRIAPNRPQAPAGRPGQPPRK